MVADIPLDIKVAVMGCVVNGPGEAKEADIGIAGGIGEGLLIKKGEIIKKVKEEELLDEDIEALIAERQQARKDKNFARADEIRDELLAKGIVLKDTREGVRWSRA